MESMYISESVEQTAEIAGLFAKYILDIGVAGDQATLVGLYGELGSGKTTFTRGFARVLGVEEKVSSPTFILERIYRIDPEKSSRFAQFVHIDTYRMEDPQEILVLDWDTLINDRANLILLEWPEKINGKLVPHIKVSFEHVENSESDSTRKIGFNLDLDTP